MKKLSFLILLLVFSCAPPAPSPIGPLPSNRQLKWQELEYYGFIHFNMNTFTDLEWGTGGEAADTFNPVQLDTDQWARIAKEAGMKGLILTAKHHDGFCLWPTKTTAHSVKSSAWRNGQGDVLRDLRNSCDKYGLKLGLYLSPWDRNNEHYGTDTYVSIFHEQLRELLTEYGELFEIWFDGANGGFGYYGGANETRKIDNKTYYQWDKTTEMVREFQPEAVIFSDGGPDVRWVGTEEGWAGETNWSTMRRDEIYPGWPKYVELRYGHEDGTHWLPAEVNTSIRPGWYYHPREDHQVKSKSRLVQTYYESIGRNGNFLLNIPVDHRGLIHEADSAAMMQLSQQIKLDFKEDLIQKATLKASNERGNNYGVDRLKNREKASYWATAEGVNSAEIEIQFDAPEELNRLVLREYIPLGQRVQAFSFLAKNEQGLWDTLVQQTTIGNKRILSFKNTSSSHFKLIVSQSKGSIVLSELGLYRAPILLEPPKINRTLSGLVEIKAADADATIYYSLNQDIPSPTSQVFREAIKLPERTLVNAVAYDAKTNIQSEPAQVYFDVYKSPWKTLNEDQKASAAFDENPTTVFESKSRDLRIDFGKKQTLKGFEFLPDQRRYPKGVISSYSVWKSNNGRKWKLVQTGEFANITNDRKVKKVSFEKPHRTRYLRIKAERIIDTQEFASFAEINIITE